MGLRGRKAAKLFTPKEHGGKVEHKYHRCNLIWTMVLAGLVRSSSGMTADTEIDSVYAVYAQQTSVTIFISAIKRDLKGGTLNPKS